MTEKVVVLTFDDAVVSQCENVVPILREFGFGATFFICRFGDNWRAKNSRFLMTAEQVRALHDEGFEIGNHTWNHINLNQLSQEEIELDVRRLNDWLLAAGVPQPSVFAYPGGPYAEKAFEVLRRAGIRAARTVCDASLNPADFDPMRVPGIPVQGTDFELFRHAISFAEAGKAAVLVFHGIPDTVHPWVDASPAFFRRCMEHLAGEGFRVCSLGEFLFGAEQATSACEPAAAASSAPR